MKIWIDADGCPVTQIVIKIAGRYRIPVVVVSNHAHVFNEREGVEVVTVDKSADRVDFVITNALTAGDLVISQDYGLHAMVLSRRAYAMQVDGRSVTLENIDAHLMRRHVHREARRKEGRYTKMKKRSDEDNRRFESALIAFLEERKKSTK